MLAYYGERGLVLFRKHLKRYLGGMPALKVTYRQMVTAETVYEVLISLDYLERQFGKQSVGVLMT